MAKKKDTGTEPRRKGRFKMFDDIVQTPVTRAQLRAIDGFIKTSQAEERPFTSRADFMRVAADFYLTQHER